MKEIAACKLHLGRATILRMMLGAGLVAAALSQPALAQDAAIAGATPAQTGSNTFGMLSKLVGKTWIGPGQMRASIVLADDARYKIKVAYDTHYINPGISSAPTTKSSFGGTVLLESAFESGPGGFRLEGTSRFKHRTYFVITPAGDLQYLVLAPKNGGFVLFYFEEFLSPESLAAGRDPNATKIFSGKKMTLELEQKLGVALADADQLIMTATAPKAVAPAMNQTVAVAPATMSPAPAAPIAQSSPSRPAASPAEATATTAPVRTLSPRAGASEPPMPVRARSDLPGGAIAPSPGLLARWGDWASLPGTNWIEGDVLYSYEWVVPGEEMATSVLTANGESRNMISLSATGDSVVIKLASGDYGQLVFPRPGIAIQQFAGRPTRTVMRFSGDSIALTEEAQKGGIWVPQQSSTRRRASGEQVAQFSRTLLAQRQQILEKWGDFATLVGKVYAADDGTFHQIGWADSSFTKIIWNRYFSNGSSLSQSYAIGPVDKFGRISLGGDSGYDFAMTNKGALIRSGSYRYHPAADGNIVVENGRFDKDSQTYIPKNLMNGWVMHPRSPQNWRNELDAAKSRYSSAQAEAGQKKKGGGGLLGGLIGAAVGGAIAGAADLDASTALATVMKGAAVGTSDGNAAAALNGAGDVFLSGNATGSNAFAASGAGGLGSNGGGAGSYPTKPNLAGGSCPGFTEGNYRQRALQGGGDTQLFTMCGQAYEYYHMYKNAIAQGYSESDANRTYAAHEQAALNAQNFAQNWSAK